MTTSTPTSPPDQRDNALHDWLIQSFMDKTIAHQRLLGDASFRAYHRLQVQAKDSTQHYIVMDAPPQKESIKEFIAVAKLLKTHGINAPQLIAMDEVQGFLVLEDFGATDFADKIGNHDPKNSDSLYQTAMQTLIAIANIDNTQAQQQADLPPYDTALLSREMGLFSEWFLPFLDIKMDKTSEDIWQNLQQTLIEQITAQPEVVVHRDFHSRNLMILDTDNLTTTSLGVIDFQDAVIGAYTYDLASLLRDAYIDFDEIWVSEQLAKFYQLATIEQKYDKSLAQFTADFNVTSLQRHLKVLGIFIRLSQRDGKDRYLTNLPKVMADLMHSAKWLSDNIIHPKKAEFTAFYNWLNDTVLPQFNQKFNQTLT